MPQLSILRMLDVHFIYNEVDLKSAQDSFERYERYERGFVQTKKVIMLINLL